MRRVYVAAGSNVQPRPNLQLAMRLLRNEFDDLVVSRAYSNIAIGFEGEDFINLVVGFTTALELPELLQTLHRVETACGRPRDAAKWAPRSMDLDLLLYGEVVGQFPGAQLPRPDLLRRAFMLGPLSEIAPNVRHPTEALTIAQLWAAFDQTAHPMTPVEL